MERLASYPDPWTNSWTFWTSDQQNTELDYNIPISPTTSKISLRSDQKRSGLFDNELAGFNPKDDAGKPDLDFDTFKLTDEEELALGFDEMGGEEDVAHMINKLAADLPGEEYLESFMDLSFLLQDNETLKSEDAESLEVAPKPQTPKSVKRKLDDVVTMEMEEPGLANIDHDYVCKKPRLATVVAMTTEDVTPSTSTIKPTPVEKYRERREKNNVASKRSREIRKMKFKEMEVEAVRLTDENEKLKVKIDALEKMAKEMKAALIQKLAGKN